MMGMMSFVHWGGMRPRIPVCRAPTITTHATESERRRGTGIVHTQADVGVLQRRILASKQKILQRIQCVTDRETVGNASN
jgi:hypothetical protein